jgi:hypothetical protein
MEDELYARLYSIVGPAETLRRRPGEQYSDRLILLVYLWSVLHDRPVSWACDPANWPPHRRPAALPSRSCMSRRLNRPSLVPAMVRIAASLRPPADAELVKTIDAKPLPVGTCSKDPDAKWGRAGRGMAKGYKLFCTSDRHGVLDWKVFAMDRQETSVARGLIGRLKGGGYLLGDALYDGNDLHERAARRNHQLVAPRKKPGTGTGHRRHSGRRLRAIEMLEGPRPEFGAALYRGRTTIEREFGRQGNWGGGLGPLPNWVRRLKRVRRWVAAKLLIDRVRRCILGENKRLTA